MISYNIVLKNKNSGKIKKYSMIFITDMISRKRWIHVINEIFYWFNPGVWELISINKEEIRMEVS